MILDCVKCQHNACTCFEGQNELLDRVSFSLGNEPANERFYNEMVAYLNEAEAELNRMREELSESKQL